MPNPGDVEQQNDSCWLAAALKLIAYKKPEAIRKTLITNAPTALNDSTVVAQVMVQLPGQKPLSLDRTLRTDGKWASPRCSTMIWEN